ncbi:MAG TPA: RraA family protein [Bryobacteraceae bacterium]|nr:RraA family protein [Bryobacteraceae bacterium]
MPTITPPEGRIHTLSPETFEAILQFDTCSIANAIESFRVRLRNEGFTRPGLWCVTGKSSRMLGYAATCRIRSADPPVSGSSFLDRTDWWGSVGLLPVPRIAVIQDLEADYGWGAAIGEVHAAVLKAFHFAGAITDGAVRDIEAVSAIGFPMLARAAAVSHAYAHLVDYGEPVEIMGLQIRSGDLLYADHHGVLSVPVEIAEQLPAAASEIRKRERRIIEICQAPGFTPEKLLAVVRSSS